MEYNTVIYKQNRKINDKSKFVLTAVAFLIALLICSIFSQYRASSFVAIGLTLLFFFAIYRYRPGYFIKYLAFVFSFFAAAIGVFAIEFYSINLIELRTYSSFEGSLPSLLFAYSVFTTIIILYDNNDLTIKELSKEIIHKESNYPKHMQYITYITIAIYLFFWARVITKPAFLLKVNRFGYAQNYMPKTTGILGIISNQLMLLAFFPIMSFIKGHRITGFVGVSIYALYNLWTGNKFGPFFSMLLIFLILLYPQISAKNSRKIRKMIILIVAAVLIVVFTALFIENVLGGTITNYTLFRFSGQGEMWWGGYKTFKGTTHISEFLDEINGLINGSSSVSENVGANYGIYKLMYLIAPKSVIDSKLSTGSRYTESGFACSYYYLGSLGCVLFALIMGIAIAGILNGFIKMIREERYLRAILFLRFFILIREAQSMFIFLEFIDPLSIISYIILIISHSKRICIRTARGRITIF